MNPFLIDLRNLPADGLHREGRLPPAFFALAKDDPVQATGPLNYVLDIRRDGKDLVVTGELGATFEMQCGRCTERFGYALELPDYTLDLPIENAQTIDLTEPLREDIILALPSYPRCEDGNINPRACPAEGRFDEATPQEPPPAEDKGVWDALDQLNR